MNPLVSYDVFFARGHGSESTNLGNILFRELVAEFSESYKASSSSREKDKIVKIIISTIQYLGGVFYHQQTSSEGIIWEEPGPKVLKGKVKQSLRDSRPRKYCSLSNMISEIEYYRFYNHKENMITTQPPTTCTSPQDVDFVMLSAVAKQEAIKRRKNIDQSGDHDDYFLQNKH